MDLEAQKTIIRTAGGLLIDYGKKICDIGEVRDSFAEYIESQNNLEDPEVKIAIQQFRVTCKDWDKSLIDTIKFMNGWDFRDLKEAPARPAAKVKKNLPRGSKNN